MALARQEWLCENCGLDGVVRHAANADVMSVVREIRIHHDILAAKYAPACRFELNKIRVRNDELMTVYQWNRMVAETKRAKEKVDA